MKKDSKQKFPTIQKKIKDFVTDETGSVTSKAAAAVGVAGIVGLGVSEAMAGSCGIGGGHFNGTTNGHYNGTGTFGASVTPQGMGSCSGYDTSYNYDQSCTTLSCSPIDGVVNGHYNVTPTCSSDVISQHCNHNNSGSGDSCGGDSCG